MACESMRRIKYLIIMKLISRDGRTASYKMLQRAEVAHSSDVLFMCFISGFYLVGISQHLPVTGRLGL